jgi:putative phosphoribosyl transferase
VYNKNDMATQVQNKPPQFVDRFEAGRRLSRKLQLFSKERPLIIAIPRGGAEIGYEIAKILGFPLSIFVSRKIGAPLNPEFGIGAVAESYIYLNQHTIERLGLSNEGLAPIIEKEQEEVKRRVKMYRNGKDLPDLRNRTIILVDDGLATGATAQAAARGLKKLSPKKIIFAAPIITHEAKRELSTVVDDTIFLHAEDTFGSVSSFYKYFNQVSDKTVIKLLSSLQPN